MSNPVGGQRFAVTYRLDEGKQAYVNRVNITGNTRTKDKVIRREMALGPGDLYNTVYADASKQRLLNLNYFDRVDVFPADTMTPGKKDVQVFVSEKRTGSLNFGAGYSTIDSIIGFVEVSQSNFDITNWPKFTGGGQRFQARIQAGAKRKDFTVALTEPYFLDYRLAVGAELFYHDADYYSSDYNQRNYGFNIFARRAITQDMYWRVDYRLENIDLYDMDSSVSPEIWRDRGNHTKSQISPSLIYDTRDSVFLPRRGTRAELSAFMSGGFLGGDVNIYGATLSASHFISLPWDTIFILAGEVAGVDRFSKSKHVPIFDTLYLGGSNNLRGFKYRDISPKDINGEPIGGNTRAYATAEFTYPIFDRVRGAFFYDVGFVRANSFNFTPKNVASDAGIGLRLDLPMFPIRIDWGYPLQTGGYTDRKKGQFNFNMGYQF